MTIKDMFKTRVAAGAATLLALGAAGGAGAVSLMRPTVAMAPTTATPVARLSASGGIVSVKGRVAEVFGDRLIVADATGRTMVDVGPRAGNIASGQPILVQGRFADGQLHAQFVVDADGRVTEVGPRGPHPHHAGPPHPGEGGAPGDGPDDPRGAAAGCAPPPLAPAAAPASAPPRAAAPATVPTAAKPN